MKRFIEGEDRGQGASLPEHLDDYVAQEKPVRVVDIFVDEVDLAKLDFRRVHPAKTGRAAYHPTVLLKLYIYGYLNRIQSSRRLKREAERNVELMWLRRPLTNMNRNRWACLLLLHAIWTAIFAANSQAEDLVNRQSKIWQPVGGAVQIPVWPEDAPSRLPGATGSEAYGNESKQIAGRPFTMVEHVARPTMYIFRPKGKDLGTTIVVFPGGGYRKLAIDLEGTEVCDWLTNKGITCVVLKYRVPGSGPYWSDECNCRRIPAQPFALQDAQRALGLLRARARELRIDPHKIGVLGFSAGGHLVADVSNREKRSYRSIDAADRESSRPDFAIAVYPGHLWEKPGLTLNPAIKISPHCPPTLIIAASDDPVDDVRHSITYYLALKKADRAVEMHLYSHGGHAFGVRRTSEPVTQWPELAEKWMMSTGVLSLVPVND